MLLYRFQEGVLRQIQTLICAGLMAEKMISKRNDNEIKMIKMNGKKVK